MNDFLQSLRGGQKDKRAPKTRRGVDNNTSPHYNQPPNYPGGYQNPRGGNVKRVTRSNVPSKYPGQDMDIPALNDDFAERTLDVLDGFLKNQERFVDIQQRRIIIEERKADALEEIVEYLRSSTAAGDTFQGYPASEREDALGGYHVEPDMATDCCEKENIGDTDPCFHAERRNIRQGFEKTVTALPAEKDLPVDDPDELPPSDLFFQEPVIPSREKSVPGKRAYIKRTDSTYTEPRKKNSQGNGKKQAKKEVKVIKRPRADKAKTVQTSTRIHEPVAPPAPDGILPREEVMQIIERMREKGATFDQVAKYLVDINQPTFSGRGEWHAQTVHRLCNRKK